MEPTYLSYFDYRRHLKDCLYTCVQRSKYYNQVITQTSLYIQQTPVTPMNQHEISHHFHILHFYQALHLSNLEQHNIYLQAMNSLID